MSLLFTLNNIPIHSYHMDFSAVRSQGPGGQHVNKTSSAIQLQCNIYALPIESDDKTRIVNYPDYRISAKGLITIKAQRYRSQEQNKIDAIERLKSLLTKAIIKPTYRKKTRPSKAKIEKRLKTKSIQSRLKKRRQKPDEDY